MASVILHSGYKYKYILTSLSKVILYYSFYNLSYNNFSLV